MRHILWIVFLPLVFMDIVAAQTRDHVLRGLSRMELVIESLGQDSKACGITEDAVRAAFTYPVSFSGLQIAEDPESLYAYININTIRPSGTQFCFSSVEMRIVAPQELKLEFSGRQALSDVVFWRAGSILTSSANRHERQVTDTIEEYAKKFISNWNLDNKSDVRRDGQTSERPESDKDDARFSTGTGFVITANGYMITNEHVVSGCSLVSVSQGSNRFEGRVIDSDAANDLALINIKSNDGSFLDRFFGIDKHAQVSKSTPSKDPSGTNFAFATIRQSPPLKAGEQAISFGYPLSGSLASEGNLTVGNVSALHGLGDDPKETQITTPVQAGSSGGPLLDRNGNVIGVVAAKLDAVRSLGITGDLPQNVNFAVGLSALKSFLARNNVPVTEAQSLDQLDPSEIGDHARLFTYSIECDRWGVDQGVVK